MLTAARHRWLLAYLDALLVVDSVEHIESVVLPGAAGLFGATVVIYHHTTHPTEPIQVDIGWPPDLFTIPNLVRYSDLADQHPLVRHLPTAVAQDAATPFTISELMPRRAWRNSAVYRDALVHLGGEDQIAVLLSVSPARVEALTMTRWSGRFDDADREMLTRARPHLAAAIRRATLNCPPEWTALQVRPDVRWVTARRQVSDGAHILTARETEVLALVSTGMTSAQIARRLGVSPRTISKHLENIYRKLAVRSRLEASLLHRPDAGAVHDRSPAAD